jgi:hypothetical protein
MEPARLKQLLAKYPCKDLGDGVIRTCPARLSFPNLAKPQAYQNEDGTVGEARYNCSLIFPVGADLSVLKKSASNLLIGEFGAKAPELVKLGKLHWPLLKQEAATDREGNMYAGYEAGGFFIRCSTARRPQLYDGARDPLTAEDFEPGYWVIASINSYVFGKDKAAKKRGASFGLRILQLLSVDDTFGGGRRADPEQELETLDGTADTDAEFGDTGGSGAEVDPFS